ncbi:unannotated protein [freshwater metagenome]|uniref:Unannotated protein n=1 Tax=freshwater metagenome TaxID=449393 RepID=A0A6J7JHT4_9ZZZZ|nr:hypothetical protein [Actinomycetota bacterium]
MQPFERLRAIARWTRGLDEESLLLEAIDCLADFDDDPAGLVVACRRLLSYHPYSARLWWVCSRVIGSMEPRMVAWDTWDQIRNDATASYLHSYLESDERPVLSLGWSQTMSSLAEISPGRKIVVMRTGDDNNLSRSLREESLPIRVIGAVEVAALDPVCVLLPIVVSGGGRVFVTPKIFESLDLLSEIPTVGVAPIGCALSENVARAFISGNEALDLRDLPTSAAATFAGPSGVVSRVQFQQRRDAPDAPELIRSLG